jgi:ribose/xylose/arabinose/galactoside ABC-type transport system permease subunit
MIRQKKNLVTGVLKNHTALFALLAIVLLAIIKFPSLLSVNVAMDVIRGYSMVGIVAMGMTFVILTGGIDLSVGAIAAVSGFSAALLCGKYWLFPVFVPIFIGTALGLLNGFVISYLRVPPFIVTLATMMGARGLSLVISKEKPIGLLGISKNFSAISQGDILGINNLIWLFVVVALVSAFVLKYTRFGRSVYAAGGNEEAARMMGIKVKPIKAIVYGVSGLCSGLAGMLLTARLSSAQNTAGQGWELTAIAAVVIGGTLLSGGRGKCSGTVYGILIYAVIETVLGRFNTMVWWINIFTALLLLVVVTLQTQGEKNRKRRMAT